MKNILQFLQDYAGGIVLLILLLGYVVWLLSRIASIFNWGRYRNDLEKESKGSAVFILTEMVVKIITDFRHFLALVLVLIFAGILVYACSMSKNPEDLSKALQTVVSTLGGLIGSIVGYYFGESAARNAVKTSGTVIQSPPVQNETTEEQVQPVETPPALNFPE